MKKLLLITVLIAVLATRIYAQIGYGPKVGGNFSFISNLDKVQPKKPSVAGNVFDIARISFHWGAYWEYFLTSKLSMGAELVYSRVGSIYNQLALKLSYTSIPCWLMYYPFGLQRGCSVYLGPALNFLWHAAPVNLVIIEEKHIDPLAWTIVGGLRCLLSFGLCVDLRYNWGLTDIFDFQAFGQRLAIIDNIQLTNHYLQLSIGYDLASMGKQ